MAVKGDFKQELSRPLDHVRFEIGDTGQNGSFLVDNETILGVLAIPNITYNQVIFKMTSHLIGLLGTSPTRVQQYNISDIEWAERLESLKILRSAAAQNKLIDPNLASGPAQGSVFLPNSPQF